MGVPCRGRSFTVAPQLRPLAHYHGRKWPLGLSRPKFESQLYDFSDVWPWQAHWASPGLSCSFALLKWKLKSSHLAVGHSEIRPYRTQTYMFFYSVISKNSELKGLQSNIRTSNLIIGWNLGPIQSEPTILWKKLEPVWNIPAFRCWWLFASVF